MFVGPSCHTPQSCYRSKVFLGPSSTCGAAAYGCFSRPLRPSAVSSLQHARLFGPCSPTPVLPDCAMRDPLGWPCLIGYSLFTTWWSQLADRSSISRNTLKATLPWDRRVLGVRFYNLFPPPRLRLSSSCNSCNTFPDPPHEKFLLSTFLSSPPT